MIDLVWFFSFYIEFEEKLDFVTYNIMAMLDEISNVQDSIMESDIKVPLSILFYYLCNQ